MLDTSVYVLKWHTTRLIQPPVYLFANGATYVMQY